MTKNTYGTKGTLLANPVKEFLIVCATPGCDSMEVIHCQRRRAEETFKKSGWHRRKNGWLCPTCAALK